jgi:two-component system, sporulation sensor kinase A
MQDKQKDIFESRFQKIRLENKKLRQKLASQKRDNNEALKSLARSELLINSMPVGFMLMQDGKVVKTNDTLLTYLGYNQEDLKGFDFLDLIHIDERDNTKNIHKLWDSGRMSPDQYTAFLISESGAPIPFEIKCKRVRFQNRIAYLLILTNIKERLEEEQKKIRDEKSKALNSMTSKVKDKIDRFSHSIMETIGEYQADAHDKSRMFKGILKKLEAECNKTLELVRQLEIIAETDQGKSGLLPVNLNDAVKGAIRSADPACRKMSDMDGIKIAIKTYLRATSTINGDFNKIQDAIFHIINNSLESMPDGGDILITTEDNNGDAHIFIQDSGTGIPPKFRDSIFDPFFTTKAGAMGLGLSMAGSIIKASGGDLDITSREGEGTIVHIKLPFAGIKTISKSKGLRKKIADSQILIIKESDVAREVFSHLLTKKGCVIAKVNNALEGLSKLKKKSFDMVVADRSALNMNDRMFIEKAKKTNSGLSVALITGEGDDLQDSYFEGIGADIIIRKPIDLNSAVKEISEILMNL